MEHWGVGGARLGEEVFFDCNPCELTHDAKIARTEKVVFSPGLSAIQERMMMGAVVEEECRFIGNNVHTDDLECRNSGYCRRWQPRTSGCHMRSAHVRGGVSQLV